MSAPATETLREIERDLRLATEDTERGMVTFPELREKHGLGHDDLEAALDILRTHGKAVEDAPGEWRGPFEDEKRQEVAPAPRVQVSADPEIPDDDDAHAAVAEAMRGSARVPLFRTEGSQPNVRINVAIANALDAESLGNLVKAGIADLEGDVFTLEVIL
jgi:hypothetical protein